MARGYALYEIEAAIGKLGAAQLLCGHLMLEPGLMGSAPPSSRPKLPLTCE
jgi:hypothetical protein